MFESVDARTDAQTDGRMHGRTPARLVYYKLTMSEGSGELIIITIFKEDNIYSMTANLPLGPTMNTDTDYYQTFFSGFSFVVSVAMLVV